MAFPTSYNVNEIDFGKIKDELREVACCAWFTSEGEVKPIMMKIQGTDGEIFRVDNIKTIYCEKLVYFGEPVMKYGCTAVVGEFSPEFKLYYLSKQNKWKIEWRK